MKTSITFVLNGVVQHVSGVPPTTTLLQWLRRDRRLTGTKEGCAEGDCGACTVVVAAINDAQVQYRAINACIQLLPMLEGASVTTVEAVSAADGALHPCQQAMVDAHASQCGFCTPGFVMSLYAMYLNAAHVPTTAMIDDTLAGNLCRCTGYGPIVDAAQRMFELPRPADEAQRLKQEVDLLASIATDATLCVEGAGRRMFVPTTEDDLARLYLENPQAVLVAGATDVGLWVTKKDRPLSVTIHVGRVGDMKQVSRSQVGPVERILLGAGLSHQDATRELGDAVPSLGEIWRRFAGLQVRNAGTIGGNIANGSPIGDLPPAMIALDAKLHLRRGDERRILALEDFFIAYGKQDRQPGEFVTGVELMLTPSTAEDFTCHKVSKRFDDDISAVCGAFNIQLQDNVVASARIAFGGMAAIPKRARAVEAALIGQPWTRATIDAATGAFEVDFAPISDARASAGYRMRIAKNLLVRTFVQRTQPELAMRLAGVIALADG